MNSDENTFKTFIHVNMGRSPQYLRLKFAGKTPHFLGVSAIDQIEAREKTRRKLPSFLANEDFLFPSVLSSEQATDERVSAFHASLINPGVDMLDMTAGLGIDAMSMAKRAKSITAIEQSEIYSDILRHNCRALSIGNIEIINDDSTEWILHTDRHFDIIYIDPARRSDYNGRVAAFADCTPDVVNLLPTLIQHAERIIIKASPMLDVHQVVREIPLAHTLYIVVLRGECKEILVDVSQEQSSGVHIICTDLSTPGASQLGFRLEDIGENPAGYYDPRHGLLPQYLYEPGAAIMKCAPWQALNNRYPDLQKVARNTHLYVSDTLYKDFPGRILIIDKDADKATMKSIRSGHFNVVCRNYPKRADEIASQHRLKGSQTDFLYCFRDGHGCALRLIAHLI